MKKSIAQNETLRRHRHNNKLPRDKDLQVKNKRKVAKQKESTSHQEQQVNSNPHQLLDEDAVNKIEGLFITSFDTQVTANALASKLSASLKEPNFDEENYRINHITLNGLNKEIKVVIRKDEPEICTIEVKVNNFLKNLHQNLSIDN